MNDTTENTENSGASAKSAFGDRGTNVNAINYGHPYSEQILNQAFEIIKESTTGFHLTKIHTTHNIPIHVMKGNGASGFNPQTGIIYLQVPGKIDKAKPEIVLELIKGLREADQHLCGNIAPDPTKDIVKYAAIMHAKALDSVVHICKVLKELTNSSFYSVLLDGMEQLGHSNVYRAYLDNASDQELYDVYAGK